MKNILTLLISIFVVSLCAGKTIYVDIDATGAENGSNWSDAYTSVLAAIDAATTGYGIWVAECTYYTHQ